MHALRRLATTLPPGCRAASGRAAAAFRPCADRTRATAGKCRHLFEEPAHRLTRTSLGERPIPFAAAPAGARERRGHRRPQP